MSQTYRSAAAKAAAKVPARRSPSLESTPSKLSATSRKTQASTPPDVIRAQVSLETDSNAKGEDSVQSLLSDILREQRALTERFDVMSLEFSAKIDAVMAENRALKEKLDIFEARLTRLESTGTAAYRTNGEKDMPPPEGVVGTCNVVNFAALVQEEVDRQQRCNNAIVRGIPEADNSLFDDCIRILKIDSYEVAHAERIGTERSRGPRPVRIKFKSQASKSAVYRTRFNLKLQDGTPIYMANDLTRQQQTARKNNVTSYKELRRRGVKCSMPYDDILDETYKPYTPQQITHLLQERGSADRGALEHPGTQ